MAAQVKSSKAEDSSLQLTHKEVTDPIVLNTLSQNITEKLESPKISEKDAPLTNNIVKYTDVHHAYNEEIPDKKKVVSPDRSPSRESTSSLCGQAEGVGVGDEFMIDLEHTASWFEGLSDQKKQAIFTSLIDATKGRLPVVSGFYRDLAPLLKVDFISLLPDRLAKHILSFCDAKSLCMAAGVSKRWHTLANDGSIWHRMCAQHINKKCTKCGWGLPLFSDKPQTKKREVVWKHIYAERQMVEMNWRNGTYKSQSLIGHTKGVTCLEFNEEAVVSGSVDHTIRVWDLQSLACTKVLSGHTNTVKCLQFDKVKVISGSCDGTIKIWSRGSGECVRTIESNAGGVVSLQFDSQHLVCGGTDSTIRLWTFSDGKCHVLHGHADVVNCVQLSDQRLVSGSDDYTVRVWDLVKRVCLTVLEGHTGEVMCAQLAHEMLVSGSMDNTIKIWQCGLEKCTATLFGHTQGVLCVQFDSLRIVSGSRDGNLIIWDKGTGKILHTLYGNKSAINALMFTDSKIITGHEDGSIRIWGFSRSICPQNN